MKVSSRLTNYYKDRIDSIDSILRMGKSDWRITHFHKLRVNAKKLRAILELVHFSSSEFNKKKYFKPYKRVFKQAGKVREIQMKKLALANLNLSESLPNYWNYLNKKEKTNKKQFYLFNNKEAINKINSSAKKIYPYTKEINKTAVEKFLKSQRANIEHLIKKHGFKKSKLHKLRKKVKIYYYIIKVFPLAITPSRKKVSKFQEVLGDWHDQIVLKKQLKEMLLSNMLPGSKKDLIKKLLKEVHEKSEKLYEKIRINEDFG